MMTRKEFRHAAGSRIRSLVFVVFILALGAPAYGQLPFDTSDSNFIALRTAVFDGLANQVGTLPNPTGGGFTYRFEPTTGVFMRATEDLGPIFSDRAETTGQGWTFNFSYTRHTFDSVDGVKLGTNSIKATVPGFSPDGTRVRLNTLGFNDKVEADVFTFGALYAVTPQLDVGVTIPILRVRVSEQPTRLFRDVRDCDVTPGGVLSNCVPRDNQDRPLIRQEKENAGIGDVVLRGKYNVWTLEGVMGGQIGLATSLDVKLPTGDEGDRRRFTQPGPLPDAAIDNISNGFIELGDPPLGTGTVRVRPLIILSGTWGAFSPHINVGAELVETRAITNDFVYAVGFDYTVLQRATFVVDVIGRHALDVKRRKVTRETGLQTDANGEPIRLSGAQSEKADADNASLSVGVRMNPLGRLILFANVLIAIDRTGVRDNVTPTFGAEWSF